MRESWTVAGVKTFFICVICIAFSATLYSVSTFIFFSPTDRERDGAGNLLQFAWHSLFSACYLEPVCV
jgi:hypothetical protein